MLQAQINPHFLYNTLGTLNWLVKAGNREDACKMIVSLGDILRTALSPRQNSTAADMHLAQLLDGGCGTGAVSGTAGKNK